MVARKRKSPSSGHKEKSACPKHMIPSPPPGTSGEGQSTPPVHGDCSCCLHPSVATWMRIPALRWEPGPVPSLQPGFPWVAPNLCYLMPLACCDGVLVPFVVVTDTPTSGLDVQPRSPRGMVPRSRQLLGLSFCLE